MEIRRSFTSSRIFSDLILLFTALVWGGGFVSQRLAARSLGFFAFNGVRFTLAALVMLPFVLKLIGKPDRRFLWILPAGGLLFAGSALQQAGMESTSAANGGFLTSVYVLLVPFFMALFWKKSTPILNWAAALVAVAGSYLLSTDGVGALPSKGDLLVLIGSVLWALHVIVVGLAVKRLNVFVFSVGQFLLAGLLHFGFSFFTQPVTLPDLQAALPAVLYAGLGSVAIGFTLQAVGQKHAPPADAALILSLESVFAALGGFLILRERLSSLQLVGAGLIFTAITLSQWMQVVRNKNAASAVQPEFPSDPVS